LFDHDLSYRLRSQIVKSPLATIANNSNVMSKIYLLLNKKELVR